MLVVGIVYGGTHYMSAKKESVAAVKEETTKNELQVYKDKAKSLIANQNKMLCRAQIFWTVLSTL